jgi:hypothetical protein
MFCGRCRTSPIDLLAEDPGLLADAAEQEVLPDIE